LSLAEVAAAAAEVSPEGDGLQASAQYDPPIAAFAYGVHGVAVHADPETGQIEVQRYVVADDCGRVINPTIVGGQMHGATLQGLGAMLYEELQYDPTGQLLTGSLMDYLVPTASEAPRLEMVHLETLSPLTVGGVKGAGEGGILGAAPALANAVADALAPLGVELDTLPASSERVWRLARAAAPGRST
jgi:carbon-monoxide dehydrogenase large subunit